ncbi:MAG: radical SAM protein [Thermoclostridium sp.]|nr:radical SAM protein [Thermoclostridium sp.]
MHYTLHLTNECNMDCDYCYVHKGTPMNMSLEIARKAADLTCAGDPLTGIMFYGGEPLLRKDFICELVAYCQWRHQHEGVRYMFKLTTNGLLLDQDFIHFAQQNGIFITISHDGIHESHDMHRKDRAGNGTFDRLNSIVDLLLEASPYTPVMLTLNPDTVDFFADSVEYLARKKFRYIITTLNSMTVWSENDFARLRKQYQRLAELYYDWTLKENKFYFSPFDEKIKTHVHGDAYCSEQCELGKHQISVSSDGILYPCVQFVDDPQYKIGDVWAGLDTVNRDILYERAKNRKDECKDCALKYRCNHHCSCLNKQTTGFPEVVSPLVCAHEQLLIPIADRLAERLYRKKSPMFIQKHYNNAYPLVSFVDDHLPKKE